MTTERQVKRYRDGYAAGHRDGLAPSGEEDELIMRPTTGDDEADAGYATGFRDGRRRYRQDAFSGISRLINDVLDVFRIPHLGRWFQRRPADT